MLLYALAVTVCVAAGGVRVPNPSKGEACDEGVSIQSMNTPSGAAGSQADCEAAKTVPAMSVAPSMR